MKKSKSLSKKKINYLSQIDFKNPFHWWGLIIAICGVLGGGAIGGFLGAWCALSLFRIGSKKDYSLTKKIGMSLLITLAGIIAYIILASIFFLLLAKIFP